MNIQSLRNKLTDLTNYIQQSKIEFHVIVLTETHLQENETKYFNLPGYDVEHVTRKSGRFGGVSIFVKKNFSSMNLIHKLDVDNNNSLLINIERYNIKIAGIYRQRTSNFDQFLNRLDHIIENYNNCYVIGDFNLDLFKLKTDVNVKKYFDLVTTNGYVFLNSLSQDMPTRVDKNRNTATCIDHIITDSLFHTKNISFKLFLDDLFGDHKAMLLKIEQQEELKTHHKKYIQIQKTMHDKIQNENLLINLSETSFQEFQLDLKKIISDNTISYEKLEKFRKSYMSTEILNLITIKQNYFKLTKKYPTNQLVKKRFRYYRNLTRKKTRDAQKKKNEKNFANSINDPSKTWKLVNNLLKNKDQEVKTKFGSIQIGPEKISNQIQIAEKFNAFFVTVANTIHDSITIDREIYTSLHEFEEYDVKIPFECEDTTTDEIKNLISSFSNSRAKDINGFSNYIFKLHREQLSAPITKLINNCLANSTFPECLKVAKVKPLFKSGNKLEMNNYRPVAISPIDSKCFEGILLNRIQNHLDKNEIISKYQFGYSKKSNCETAVLHVLNQIYQNVDNKLYTACVFIDATKAFDCLLHDLLIKKFDKLGFPLNFMNLLKSYLSDRLQYVQIDECISQLLTISKGVFQGSKLAAVCFLIYINSIFNLPLNGKMFLYADDVAIVYGATNLSDLKSKIEYDLRVLKIWMDNHLLKINVKKTKYILFNGRTRFESFTETSLNIRYENEIIERVESFSYLGLIIDEQLSFRQHIEHVRSKILPMTFAIRRIRHFISQKTADLIYFAHINSHLLYMNPFWNAATDQNLTILEIAQRKSLRIILNKYSYSPSSELFSKRFLPLKVMNDYNLILMAFKINHNLLRNNVEIRRVNEVHQYQTRQTNHFYIERYETNFGFSNFFKRGLIKYNQLDANLLRIHEINRFKNELKNFLYEQYISLGI